MLVEIGHHEDAFEDRDVAGPPVALGVPPLAALLGMDLRDVHFGLADSPAQAVLTTIAIGPRAEEAGPGEVVQGYAGLG